MIAILTATLNDGTSVILEETINRDHLRDWRRDRQFRCPQCGERVLLKVGDIRIPHFAHEAESECAASFSEGESIQHLEGKQLLYSLFQRLQIPAVLEPLLPELAQRPDLLARINGHAIPIEFQCSRIPETIQKRRTAGYQSIGMKPIWILSTPEKVRKRAEGVELFSFSAFHQQFFTTSVSPGATLLTLSPETKQFHYVSHLLHIDGNRFIGIHRKLPVHLQVFPFARPKLPDENTLRSYVAFYTAQRTTYLQRSVFLNRRGVQDPFLRGCYELKYLPTALPRWIGVPTKGNEAFNVNDCEWQVGLIYLLKRHQLTPSRFPIHQLRHFVRSYAGSEQHKVQACIAYLEFLERVDWKKKELVADERIENELLHLLKERFLAKRREN